MKTGAKVIAGIGIGALSIFGISRLLAQPPPEGDGAAIGIVILGPDGLPVPKNSPASLLEGESYTVQVTVVNASTKAGQPWEATLDVITYGDGAVTYFYPPVSVTELFAPGQDRTFEYPLNIPMGYGGQSGSVWAWVRDPAGVELARASEPITIESVAIVYGADIVIGV